VVVSGPTPAVGWVFAALVFALGACLLWLAVDCVRRRRALWVEGDAYIRRSGFVRRGEDPLRFWTWIFIYALSGLLCVGFPVYLAWTELG
jgi:hypothetical protein